MTGYQSKKAAARDKMAQPAQEPTLQKKDRKRGSIALARSLCYQINGAADDSDDMDGGGYGSVDIAEILSAEVVRLQAALAQPAQEPLPEEPFGHMAGGVQPPQRPWVEPTGNEWFEFWRVSQVADATEAEIDFADFLIIAQAVMAKLKEKNG